MSKIYTQNTDKILYVQIVTFFTMYFKEFTCIFCCITHYTTKQNRNTANKIKRSKNVPPRSFHVSEKLLGN